MEIEEPKLNKATPTPLSESTILAATPTESIFSTLHANETTTTRPIATSRIPSLPYLQPRTPSPSTFSEFAGTMLDVIDVDHALEEVAIPTEWQLRVDDQSLEVNLEWNSKTCLIPCPIGKFIAYMYYAICLILIYYI